MDLDKLTYEDSWNLADIAWFLRGMNYGKEYHERPFGPEHFKTLEDVIQGIRRNEKTRKHKDDTPANP